jgi:hypothetical protein
MAEVHNETKKANIIFAYKYADKEISPGLDDVYLRKANPMPEVNAIITRTTTTSIKVTRDLFSIPNSLL